MTAPIARMRARLRHVVGPRRATLHLAVVLVLMAVSVSSTAGAGTLERPPAPSGSYRPAFVTETDEIVWTDCLWSASTMFLDAWTRGALVADREALRAASGDLTGGSSLGDLRRGAAAYAGLEVRWSPYGGDPLDWTELLDRLAHGGAAVVLGWYSALPAHYTRWDPRFAGRGEGASGHSLFVTDYQPATDSLWLMDPLGRGDYVGEWIAASDLRRFVWTTDEGVLYAAVTPESETEAQDIGPTLAPFAGFGFAPPVILDAQQTGSTVELAVPIGDALGAVGARFPHVRLRVIFTRLGDAPTPPIDGAVGELAVASPGATADPEALDLEQVVDPTIQGDGLRAYITLPQVAGRYRLSLALVDPDGAEYPVGTRPDLPSAIVIVEDHPAPRPSPSLGAPEIPTLVIPTETPEPSAMPSPWPTPTPSATPTTSPIPSDSASPSPMVSPTPSVVPTASPGATATPDASATPTTTPPPTQTPASDPPSSSPSPSGTTAPSASDQPSASTTSDGVVR